MSAPTVDLDVTHGEPDPPAATVNVTNAGDGTLSNLAVGAPQYTQGQADGWLQAQLSANSAPATLSLQATVGALGPGIYSAVVPVTADNATNSPQNVVVNFVVVAPARIEVDREQVSVVAAPGGTAQEQIAVTNGGGRPLTGLAASVSYETGTTGWLSASLSATTAPTTLVLNVSATGLAQGTYTARVDITSTVAGVAAKTVAVALAVGPGPAIGLNPTTVAFNAATTGGAPPAQTVAVTNAGGGLLTGLSLDPVSYTQPGSWLSAQLDAATAPANITLTVNPAGLATGSYDATVTVRSPIANNSPMTLPVTLTIGPPPVLAVAPDMLTFSSFVGGTQAFIPTNIAITNASGSAVISGLTATVTYTSGPADDWLSNVNFGGGKASTPTTVQVAPSSTALPRGLYTADVEIRSADPTIAPDTIKVTYELRSFSFDIAPLFTDPAVAVGSSCSGCHPVDNATAAYSYARAWVSPPNENAGKLVCKITTAPMAGGACPGTTEMRMTAGAVALIKAWIRAGAPSN
ncbi:MAG: hypothetical protein ACRELX_15920, partial [Longimicrobiales bacterium]